MALSRVPRNVRWTEAVEAVRHAIDNLQSIQSEYQDWSDNMPESFQDTPTGQKLEALCDLDLGGESIADIEEIAPPLGFGRD